MCNESAVSVVLCKPQNKESFSQFCFDIIWWTIIAKVTGVFSQYELTGKECQPLNTEGAFLNANNE